VTRVGDTEYHAKLVATRRIYIADKLQSESALAYSVVVEAGAPTTANPYGLFVTGQAISPYLKSEQEADVRLR
jgi:hypothetical protein